MKKLTTYFAIVLAFLTIPERAFAETIPGSISSVAKELADIVLPREQLITVRMPRFEADFVADLKNDPELVSLEKTQPGITDAVMIAAREEGAEAYGKAIDFLRDDIARLYNRNFSPDELQKLIDFFSTPTGQAMIELSAGADGDTASDFETDRRAKLMAMFENPDDATKADLTMLMNSGLMPKIVKARPEISALSERRFGDVTTLLMASLDDRIEAVKAAYPKGSDQ
jgi:Uncharacterized protein conserved in bacteria (DUF2059)